MLRQPFIVRIEKSHCSPSADGNASISRHCCAAVIQPECAQTILKMNAPSFDQIRRIIRGPVIGDNYFKVLKRLSPNTLQSAVE
jgi:hypothetical protein